MAKTEREAIDAVQKHLAAIKRILRDQITPAKEAGKAEHVNAWYKAMHKTGLLHAELTDDLLRLFPEFADEVVTKGLGR